MVVEMAQEDYGHLLLLSIMDVTDDTVLVTKGLLNVHISLSLSLSLSLSRVC